MKKNSLKKVVKISSGLFLAAVLCMPVMGTVEASVLTNKIPSFSTINLPTTNFHINTTTTQNAYGIDLIYNTGKGGYQGDNNLQAYGAVFDTSATKYQVAGIALATNTGNNNNHLYAVGGEVDGKGISNTAMGLAWARNEGSDNNSVNAAGSIVSGTGNSGYGIGYAYNTGNNNNTLNSTGVAIQGGTSNTAVGVSLVENTGEHTTINGAGVFGYNE